jgi:ribosomal protein S18 acetylase RimI-like enzyme
LPGEPSTAQVTPVTDVRKPRILDCMSDATGSPSLTTRAIRWRDDETVHPDDLDAITRIMLEADAAGLSAPDLSAGEVERMLALPSVDWESSCLAVHGDEVVGVLRIELDRPATTTRIDACSLPWPGSTHLRGMLVDRGLEIARRHKAAERTTHWKARAGASVTDAAYIAILRSRGMRPVRRFYRMRIDSGSALIPAVAQALPDGVEIVTAHDDATLRIVHRVDMAAFADHWGHTDYTYEHWIAFVSILSPDPDDWWLLTVEGEPAAICLLDDRKALQGEGYIAVLGVLRDFRGRGLAQLLLHRAFLHYRDLGRQATSLNVDATNTTGAVTLYEKVGMSSVLVREAYEHSLG